MHFIYIRITKCQSGQTETMILQHDSDWSEGHISSANEALIACKYETNSRGTEFTVRTTMSDWTEGRKCSERILIKPSVLLSGRWAPLFCFWQHFSFVTTLRWWRFTELEAHLTDLIIQERVSHSSHRWISLLQFCDQLWRSSCHSGRSSSDERFWFREGSGSWALTKASWSSLGDDMNTFLAKTVMVSLQNNPKKQ